MDFFLTLYLHFEKRMKNMIIKFLFVCRLLDAVENLKKIT